MRVKAFSGREMSIYKDIYEVTNSERGSQKDGCVRNQMAVIFEMGQILIKGFISKLCLGLLLSGGM